MGDVLSLIVHHGYAVVFLIVFLEAIGMPVPAALALVGGGAAVAAGALRAPELLVLALAAMLLGDCSYFVLGKRTGWRLLGFLCKLSINPETCILRSAESFYKRGRTALVFAKFIPGVNTMAPPLAGSMKMPFWQFLGLDFVGASLYALAYGTIGFVFRDFLVAIARGLQTAGHAMEIVIAVAAVVYIVHRVWQYRKHRGDRIAPRVQVAELAKKLQSEDSGRILLVDVRSYGYYDAGAARIQGSIRLEPNSLPEAAKKLPKDKDIYLYCT